MTAGEAAGAWRVEHLGGRADELHARTPPDDGVRRLWSLTVDRPALVLGSTQTPAVVDREALVAAGADLVRRRSGGGAVWVQPGDPIWVDVLVPRGDRLWRDDVGRAFGPIGTAWSQALAAVGVPSTEVHEGPMLRTAWSDLVCFAGVGPGEVRLGEAKVVGISQRRTRHTARFQCALPRVWDPGPLSRLLRDHPPVEVLAQFATGIGEAVDGRALVGALVEALTSSDLA